MKCGVNGVMNPAGEMAAKIGPTERQSVGAAAGVIDRLDEQLRVSVEALLHPSPPPEPVEEVDALLLAISRHLDEEASERKAVRNRLLAIDNAMERLASRGFRYLVAICIGVAAILAWQSYGDAAKQIIATKAPELAWSPQTKQMSARGSAKCPLEVRISRYGSTLNDMAGIFLSQAEKKFPALFADRRERVEIMRFLCSCG
jgi:hypothetical protein